MVMTTSVNLFDNNTFRFFSGMHIIIHLDFHVLCEGWICRVWIVYKVCRCQVEVVQSVCKFE
jgi:hypothetical protein